MYRSISAWTAGDGGGESLPIFFFAFFATLEYLLNRVNDIVHVLETDRVMSRDYEPPSLQPKHRMRSPTATLLKSDGHKQSAHVGEIAILAYIPNTIEQALKPFRLDHVLGFPQMIPYAVLSFKHGGDMPQG
jgi:hypothetical protein